MDVSMKKGFGIVEILVALALGGILLVFLTQIISTGLKGSNTVQNMIEFDLMSNTISLMARTPAACVTPFKKSGVPVVYVGNAPVDIDEIYMGLGTAPLSKPIVQKVTPMAGGLMISSITLNPALAPGVVFNIGATTYTSYLASLTITAAKGQSFGGQTVSRSFTMEVDTDAANSVSFCGYPGGNELFLSDPVPVFYSGQSPSNGVDSYLAAYPIPHVIQTQDIPIIVALPAIVPDSANYAILSAQCTQSSLYVAGAGQNLPVALPTDPNWDYTARRSHGWAACLATDNQADHSQLTVPLPPGPNKTIKVLYHDLNSGPISNFVGLNLVGWK